MLDGRWGSLTGFVDDCTAEGSEAHHSQIEHGIYVSNSADRPVVRGNPLHHNHANGLHMNGDASRLRRSRLPAPGGLVSTVIVGRAAAACAALEWNPPEAPRPRCRASGDAISCR
jgi:hypothetical protein